MGHLVDIGLGYPSLDRATDTLSGGEAQRVKIVRHLASTLADLLYVFDEPSIGLHPGTCSASPTSSTPSAITATPCWWSSTTGT